MRKYLSLVIAVLGLFALGMQLYLLLENRTTTAGEALVRYVSYFTILTNSIVAIHFLRIARSSSGVSVLGASPSLSITAVTLYITLVGVVYQVALRHIWNPQGWQMIVDELLHTVIPILVLLYWILYASASKLSWRALPVFLIYPMAYLTFILIRGLASGFYPYYFLDVGVLGWPEALRNIFLLFIVILFMAAIFIAVSRRPDKP